MVMAFMRVCRPMVVLNESDIKSLNLTALGSTLDVRV